MVKRPKAYVLEEVVGQACPLFDMLSSSLSDLGVEDRVVSKVEPKDCLTDGGIQNSKSKMSFDTEPQDEVQSYRAKFKIPIKQHQQF